MLPERSFAAVKTMTAGRELKQFNRNAMDFHGRDKLAAVLRRHGFVINSMSKKSGRSVGRNLRFIGIKPDEFGLRIRTKEFVPGAGVRVFAHRDDRIDEPCEIGPATESLDGIGRLGVTVIEVRGGSRSNVAAGGETENADTFWVNLPRSGVGTGEADGSLGVE